MARVAPIWSQPAGTETQFVNETAFSPALIFHPTAARLADVATAGRAHARALSTVFAFWTTKSIVSSKLSQSPLGPLLALIAATCVFNTTRPVAQLHHGKAGAPQTAQARRS